MNQALGCSQFFTRLHAISVQRISRMTLTISALTLAVVWFRIVSQSSPDDGSRVCLALAVVGYCIWNRRKEMGFRDRPHFRGLPYLAFGAIGLIAGAGIAADRLAGIGTVLITFGMLLSYASVSAKRLLFANFSVLLLAVATPGFVTRFVSVPLAHGNAKIVGSLLCLSGRECEVLGSLVVSGDLQLQVVDACDGLRLFWAVLFLSYAQVIVSRCSLRNAVILLAFAPAIALVINSIRILVVSFLFSHLAADYASVVHDASGFAMMACAWLLPYCLLSRLNGQRTSESSAQVEQEARPRAAIPMNQAVAGQLAIWLPIVVLPVALAHAYLSTERLPRGASQRLASSLFPAIPFRIGHFMGVQASVPERQLDILQPDACLARRYQGEHPNQEILLIATLHDRVGAIDGHAAITCYTNLGWQVRDHTEHQVDGATYVLRSTQSSLSRQRTDHEEQIFVYKASLRPTRKSLGRNNPSPGLHVHLVFSPEVRLEERQAAIDELITIAESEYAKPLNLGIDGG